MTIETFIKYTRWTGMFKKTRTEDYNHYMIEFYKLRWFHPFTWILFIIGLFKNIFSLIKEMLHENDEIEIHKRKQ